MKKVLCKTGILLIPVLVLSGALSAQPVTKEYHKKYTAGPGTTLNIGNKYGFVKVSTQAQNEVTIDVKVTVELPNRERAEKLISYIDVQFSEGENMISAKTVIDEKFNFTGWGIHSRKFSIDYTVNMPADINLTLLNRYGNTELDDIDGQVNLDIKYGNLTAGSLTRGNEKPLNRLNLAYGDASINSAGWMDLIVRYAGNVEVKKCQALLLDSRYSKMGFGETSSLVGESKYDNLRIGKINNLILDAGYSDISIETLNKKLKFDGGYGALTVEQIPTGFESIETNTRYLGVKLGIDTDASYSLDAKLSYGDLKFDESNFQHQRRIVENNRNETSGIVGKESEPSAVVKVTASYGSVRLEN